MPAETVRDVLDRARAFHRELGEFYHQLEDASEKARVKLVLEYLRHHETFMEECLTKFEDGASANVLTWYKNTPDAATHKCFENLEVRPDMTAEDVMRVALRLDECLIRLYRGMAERAPSAEVRELFDDLLKLELREERNMVRDTGEMEDL